MDYVSKSKTRHYKTLRGKHRQNPLWHKFQQYLSYPPPRAVTIKKKKNGLIKLKSFCTAKETINKTKRQPMDWEKIFAKDVTDKGLFAKHTNSSYSSIYKNPTQLKNGQNI